MKNILISSFDMEVGGVERSLISMLDNFDYDRYKVDLMLYSHTGDFMNLLTAKVNMIPQVKKLATFRKGISQIMKEGNLLIGTSRVLAKLNGDVRSKLINKNVESVVQMQLMWKYCIAFLT